MFDFARAERPASWMTESEACRKWFESTFKPISVDAIESSDNDHYLRCRDLPEVGSTISLYGEYGCEERFYYTVTGVDIGKEMVFAEGENGEEITIPFVELANLDDSPIWNTVWVLDDEPTYQELQELNDCDISVYEDCDGNWYFGIDGANYDFYEKHWLKLYRRRGICWHSTQDLWMGELEERISSYVEMCAEMPTDITWKDRSDVLRDAVDVVLDPKGIERFVRRRLRAIRLKQVLSKLDRVVSGKGSRRSRKPRRLVPACD